MFRGHIARLEFLVKLHDVIMVQSLVRRWISTQKSKIRLSSIVTLQCFCRMTLAKLQLASLWQAKRQREIERKAAITIQRVLRGAVARQTYSMESAARQIQKTWRCYTIHVEYMFSILAAIDIQAAFRRYFCRKRYHIQYSAVTKIQAVSRGMLCRMHLVREERCAIVVQSVVRMFLCRLDFVMYLEEVQCATSIQAFFRMHAKRAQFMKHQFAVLTLQRYARGYIDRLQLETEHFASTEIARVWRGHETREKFAWCILSAMKMQSVLRMFLTKRKVESIRANILAAEHLRILSARKLQRSFRAYKCRKLRFGAACIIQRSIARYFSRITFRKIRQGVLKGQAAIRGKFVRQKQSAAVKAILSRIEQANEFVRKHPEHKLGNKTRAALRILQTSRSLSEIMEAVCTLEIATRLSEVCCESFVLAGAPDILFSLIRTCNRSLPHVKLLHGVLLTMCNVAQYCHLLPSMATSYGVEILLDLVQMFRDKEPIFCLVIALLDRAVQQSPDVVVS
jgi:abnormal spindle-like microcephaly-associated protein